MTARIARRFVVYTMLLVFTTGCVMLRAGELPRVSPWPPASASIKKTVSITVASGQSLMNGSPGEPPPAMVERRRELVQAEYAGSGLFAGVVPDGHSADLRADVIISEDGEGSQVLAFISGFTLGVIPARAKGRMTMQTTFRNADGDTLARIEKSETTTMWIQILLIFAMPFNRPMTVANEAFEDLSRATLVDAHAQGVL